MKTWAFALAIESLIMVYVLAARFFPALNSLEPILTGNGKPILLVHGYCNNSWVWVVFRKRLANLGLGPIYSINLGYPFQSLEVYSRKIEKKAQEIAKDTNCRDLVLIGHSMGGIASALYAKKAAPHTVSHLITIASPWEGTPVAWLAIGANAKEIRPHSPLLASISNIQQEREDMQLFQVASSCDLLVIPGESAARKVQAERRLIIDDLGHTSLLFSKRVAQQVAIWLTNRG